MGAGVPVLESGFQSKYHMCEVEGSRQRERKRDLKVCTTFAATTVTQQYVR